MAFKKIVVMGLGYIGLPTAAVLASRGMEVIGVDVKQSAVDTINQGNIHIIEPDLDIVVRSVVTTGNLRASTTPENADAFMIAVPTPLIEDESGTPTPDLSFVQSAVKSIAPFLEPDNLVVLESTSPVGSTEMIARLLKVERPDLHFPNDGNQQVNISIAHCPERVLPGYVLQELVSNDRLIGGLSENCSIKATELYQSFVRGDCIKTNARTAEMAKLTENSFRDVNIAFANELSIICEKLKINVWELIKLSNRHPRVDILKPGPGVGGHCIAVDPWFIVNSCPDEAKMIRQARLTNQFKPFHVIEKVTKAADEFKHPVIGCLGLSFKANIDDLRESPAVSIVQSLLENENLTLMAVEPNIHTLPSNLHSERITLNSVDEVLEEANIVLVLVDHNEFQLVDRTRFSEKVVIDTRGII